jgi:hypothetical protein
VISDRVTVIGSCVDNRHNFCQKWNKCLTSMDYFNKRPEGFFIPNQQALTMADAFVSNFICCRWVTRKVHSDQGRNFASRLLYECKDCKKRISSVHPQSEGIVERYVNKLGEYLRKVVSTYSRSWVERIPSPLPTCHYPWEHSHNTPSSGVICVCLADTTG